MTGFRIERLRLDKDEVTTWAGRNPRHRNWPVVYALDGQSKVYVGESLNAAGRLRQHLAAPAKQQLASARVVLDETFNKSVCLDLESFLITMLAGDGRFEVLNRNDGITDADYYDRTQYRAVFSEIFAALRDDGLFEGTIPEIENSDLFKLSPFKALTPDQSGVVNDILEGLFDDLQDDRPSRIVIQGDPGTGKTVIAVFLMKLLADINGTDPASYAETDSLFAQFFLEGYPEELDGLRIGLVVPQASLRKTVKRVFRKTPRLHPSMVLSAFEVGQSKATYDLLIVDETHRLRHAGNQPNGSLNTRFSQINTDLFGTDDPELTQLDWINAKSKHQIFLMDSAQSVHTGDVPTRLLDELVTTTDEQQRRYRLYTQMRVRAGEDYVGYIRSILSSDPPRERREFADYDLRLFDDIGAMRTAVLEKEVQTGLARMIAGFAWPWVSRKDPEAYDIAIDGTRLRWNTVTEDWVNSPTSVEEVGVIHTIQGYDLNYAGVIIGNDLRYHPERGLWFDRASYFDPTAANNIKKRGLVFTTDDILKLVENIYAVLLTRGICGTYVYACDPGLREYLRRFLPTFPGG